MRRLSFVLALVVATWCWSAVSAQNLNVELQRATQKELVSGDLKAAIEEYRKIIARAGSNREVAARALVHMAECYQKLGDAESRKIYERIVREFADQKVEVALARARLGGTADVARAKDWAVWTGPKVDALGQVSPDGRFIIGRDPDRGNLMIHDIAANVDRALTPPEPPTNWSQFVNNSRISRDGKQVVYVWWDNYAGARLRLATLPGSGFLEPREVFGAGCSADACPFIGSLDLSPDRKWIAAVVPLKNGSYEIALIAVADGSFRVLKSMNGAPQNMFFSPDGRYIAYDLPANDTSQQRDVLLLAIDGSREVSAVVHSAHDAVMGWSPDGTRLLFSSDRTGTVGLWAQPFADGKSPASPELLKSDIGTSVSLGLTASGALYVHKRISTRDIAIARIDLDEGKLLGPAVPFTQGFVDGSHSPLWSPDGKYLAYAVTCHDGCIAIRSVATGQVRRLAPTLDVPYVVFWSPDGRSLLTRGTDVRGRTGIFQIDVLSGQATALILGDELGGLAQVSPDGKKLYLNRGGMFVERDLAAGRERDLIRGKNGLLSPDGQYLAVSYPDRSTNTANPLLVPIAGGQPRELLHLTTPETIGPTAWTPDSSAVIIVKDTGSRRELWLVPVAGGRPRKLDVDPDIWMEGGVGNDSGFSLSPDGRSIAFHMGKTASEVWALENFLPAPKASR